MSDLVVVGWREWVTLPSLCPTPLKAKVDTGALTSAIHAEDVRLEVVDGVEVARFVVLPHQGTEDDAVEASAPMVDHREVRSSSGEAEVRPTVRTTLRLGGVSGDIELTLASRDQMGFRMLLGRRALRRRFLVDPGGSYVTGTPDGAR